VFSRVFCQLYRAPLTTARGFPSREGTGSPPWVLYCLRSYSLVASVSHHLPLWVWWCYSNLQALTELYRRILQFTPCCPPETRGDRLMLIVICDTLKNETWAEDTCSLRLSDGNIKFATMYGKPAAILTEKLQKEVVLYSIHAGPPAMVYPISFGQRFAQTPDPPRRPTRHNASVPLRADTSPRRPNRSALPTDTFLRCKGKGHWAADCNS
jgi:hypothetical protein